jgi:hypothetical protein
MGWLPAMRTLAQQLQADPRRAEEVRIGKLFSFNLYLIILKVREIMTFSLALTFC